MVKARGGLRVSSVLVHAQTNIDFPGFARVGHPIGKELLCKLAAALRKQELSCTYFPKDGLFSSSPKPRTFRDSSKESHSGAIIFGELTAGLRSSHLKEVPATPPLDDAVSLPAL